MNAAREPLVVQPVPLTPEHDLSGFRCLEPEIAAYLTNESHKAELLAQRREPTPVIALRTAAFTGGRSSTIRAATRASEPTEPRARPSDRLPA